MDQALVEVARLQWVPGVPSRRRQDLTFDPVADRGHVLDPHGGVRPEVAEVMELSYLLAAQAGSGPFWHRLKGH
ncbi:hypothetical protein GCM10023317_48130 [Actinopolymorpha pittospori]